MDLNDKILDFLDGVSSLEDDKALLSSLADNPEMLAKMKKLMAMESSVLQNPEYFEPPVATTSKVFDNLGYTYGARGGILAGLGAYLSRSKVATAIGSSVITIILLSTLYYFFSGNGEGNASNQIAINKSEVNSTQNSFEAIGENNVASNQNDNANSFLDNALSYETANQANTITKYINRTEYATTDADGNIIKFGSLAELKDYRNNLNDEKSNLLNSTNIKESGFGSNVSNSNILGNISSSEIQNTRSESYFRSNSSVLSNNQIPIREIDGQNFNFQAPKGFEFSILSSLGGKDLTGVSENLVNFKLAWLPVNRNRISFGLEMSRENFFQTYTNDIDATRRVDYTQNPALWTLGVSARASLYEDQKTLNPYFQVSTGGALSNDFNLYPGFFYRGILATKVSLDMLPFSLNIGAQYTGLSTNQFGQYFQSNNMSIIFGVNF